MREVALLFFSAVAAFGIVVWLHNRNAKVGPSGTMPATGLFHSRTQTKPYSPPYYLYKVSFVWSPAENKWVDFIWPVNTWVFSREQPRDQNVASYHNHPVYKETFVQIAPNTLNGPFQNSGQLCPRVKALHVHLARNVAEELGCPSP